MFTKAYEWRNCSLGKRSIGYEIRIQCNVPNSFSVNQHEFLFFRLNVFFQFNLKPNNPLLKGFPCVHHPPPLPPPPPHWAAVWKGGELQLNRGHNVEAAQSISGSENRCLTAVSTTLDTNTFQHFPTLGSRLMYQQCFCPPLPTPYLLPDNQPTNPPTNIV